MAGPRTDASADMVARFGEWLAEYQRQRGDRVLVSWIGGEPFLWPPLRDMTVRFTTQLGLRVSATTNGTALGCDAMREHVIEHYTELTVSVDAPGAAHDRWRGWRDGFDAMKAAVIDLAARKRLAGRGPRLRANAVLMRDNTTEFASLCQELAAWGIEEITFNQLGGRDRPEFFPEHRLRPNDVTALEARLPELRADLAARGVLLRGGEDYLRRIRASTRDESLPVTDCQPGERFLFLDETGRVAPCNHTVETLGISAREIGSNGRSRSLAERFTAAIRACRPAACKDCQSTQVWTKFAP